jgi:hypothetical protein
MTKGKFWKLHPRDYKVFLALIASAQIAQRSTNLLAGRFWTARDPGHALDEHNEIWIADLTAVKPLGAWQFGL